MRRQIFIHINDESIQKDDNIPVSWVVKEPNQMPGPVFYGDLETAANHANGCRVTVFVSGLNILLTDVDLPAMNKQRLARAIPFALEEHVASDVEDLHFAQGNRIEDKTACAVVERNDMETWQHLLKQANIQADVLTSECFGVSCEENVWTVLVNQASDVNQKALLRTGTQSGFAMDLQNMPFILRNALEITEQEKLPSRVEVVMCEDSMRRQTLISAADDELPTIHATDDDPESTLVPEATVPEATQETAPQVQEGAQDTVNYSASSPPESPAMGLDINQLMEQAQNICEERVIGFSSKSSDQAYLGILSLGFNEANSINLLQGEYSRREQLEKLIRPWRVAIGLVATWLLIQGGLLVTEYYHLANKDRQLSEQIIAAYKDAFPDAKNIPNPKVQMERALEKLKQGGESEGDLFQLLSKAGEVIGDTKTMILRSIRYKDNKMDIELEISDLASLDELKLRLNKQAELNVEIVSASARGGKVESRLQVQLPSNS